MDPKKYMVDAFKKLGKELDLGAEARVAFSSKVGGFTVEFPDGTRAFLQISRYTNGMPSGEFVADPTFAMYDGPIPRLGATYGVSLTNPWASGLSPSVVPRLRENSQIGYRIGVAREPEATIGLMLEDVRSRMVPVIRAFALDHSAAVDLLFDESYVSILSGYPLAVALMLVESSGRFDRFDDVVRKAEVEALRLGGELGPGPRALIESVRARVHS